MVTKVFIYPNYEKRYSSLKTRLNRKSDLEKERKMQLKFQQKFPSNYSLFTGLGYFSKRKSIFLQLLTQHSYLGQHFCNYEQFFAVTGYDEHNARSGHFFSFIPSMGGERGEGGGGVPFYRPPSELHVIALKCKLSRSQINFLG